MPTFAVYGVDSQFAGLSGLMHARLLLTQHFLAVAADFMLRCSPSRGSSHSLMPTSVGFRPTLRRILHELTEGGTKLTLTPRRSMAAFNGGIFRESTSGGNWASESKVTFPFGPFKVPTSGNHFNRQDFIPTTEQPKNLKKEGVKISWRNEPHWQ